MATQLLNLPINIPWKFMAVSPDMMDTKIFNKRFPFEWRSSIAISAYEPGPEELPGELCEELITYLKITCTITGYQPSKEETHKAHIDFTNIPTEKLNKILGEYLACYGVLLNVAVFPFDPVKKQVPKELQLKDYPHIISLEPKTRDLYQAATETGEVLTASNSKVGTDKSFSHTENSQTGLSITGRFGKKDESGVSGNLSQQWGKTDQATKSIETDASRERRETQGTTTQLSQMYNLLTGYHQGTNRAVFLMLPRPHVLQPTDHRTFVQGLRHIEGMQEFMLIVARPKKVKALCIEAFLETGHFPEDVDIEDPEQEFETRRVEFALGPIKVSNGGVFDPGRNEKDILEERRGFEVDGWQFDPNRGEPGLGGIEELRKLEGDNADGNTNGPTGEKPAMENYSYKTETPDKAVVLGKLRSRLTSDTVFHRLYSVYLRRSKTTSGEPSADVSKLLTTSRGLFVCIRSGEECPEVVPHLFADPGIDDIIFKESIVDEHAIKIPPALLTRETSIESRQPAMKELLRKIQNTLSTSWRMTRRYPAGEVGYLESDYFKDQIKEFIPEENLRGHISQVKGLASEVVKSLGDKCTVEEALDLSFMAFVERTGLNVEDAKKARSILLGIEPDSEEEY